MQLSVLNEPIYSIKKTWLYLHSYPYKTCPTYLPVPIQTHNIHRNHSPQTIIQNTSLDLFLPLKTGVSPFYHIMLRHSPILTKIRVLFYRCALF